MIGARVGDALERIAKTTRILQIVIPAKAGTQCLCSLRLSRWVPAFAGMTAFSRTLVQKFVRYRNGLT
jgi:hypothetical protein